MIGRILKRPLPYIISLIIVDQLIKIIIAGRYMNLSKDIIKGLVAFHPIINSHYSWLNSLFRMGIGLTTHILFNILVILFTGLLYLYIKRKYPKDTFTFWLFTFLFAGLLCSLIDKLFWGGSLDYIWLKGLFIFDLKDVYLIVFEVLLIWAFLFNYKGFRDVKCSRLLADLGRFIKTEIRARQKRK